MRPLLLKLVAVLLVLLAGTVAMLALAPVLAPADPFSEEGAACFKEGMTEEEVKGLLGGVGPSSGWGHGKEGVEYAFLTWLGESGQINVSFENGRVVEPAEFIPGEPPPLLDRLSNRLRRLLPW